MESQAQQFPWGLLAFGLIPSGLSLIVLGFAIFGTDEHRSQIGKYHPPGHE